jgi:hypothetical protein
MEEADRLTSWALTNDDPNVRLKIERVLLSLVSSDRVNPSSRANVCLNLAKLSLARQDQEASDRYVKKARTLDDSETSARIRLDPVLGKAESKNDSAVGG